MKLKVMRIIARLNIGGPAIHTVLLTERLDKKKFESLLVTGEVGTKEGDMRYFAQERGVTPIYITGLQREISWVDDLVSLRGIYRLLKQERPHIIHTHTAKAGTLGRLAAVFLTLFSPGMGLVKKKPFLLFHTFHGHVFHDYFGPIKTRLFLWLERFLAKFTDRIIAISESQMNELCNKYKVAPPQKFRVIPLGFDFSPFINVESFRGRLRKELVLSEDDILVGIIGRLVPIKNHRLFLESAAKVMASVREHRVKFLVVGDGELRDELENLRDRLGLQDDVFFLGWRKDLRPIYADIDIVALTSLNEGTPVALVEAMAAGKSVIATDVGGVSDILVSSSDLMTANPDPIEGRRKIRTLLYGMAEGVFVTEKGILVRSGDSEGFARGIIFLVNNRGLRENMGHKGRMSVDGKYSRERLVRDMEMLYEEVYASQETREIPKTLQSEGPPVSEKDRQTVNSLTIDFEDWYQGLELQHEEGLGSRIEKNAEKVLSILDECNTKATFFILGRVAEDFPWLIREIAKRGHELGSHGYLHKPVYALSPEDFRRDLCASLNAITKAGGGRISIYRAPYFSITERSLWAFSVLGEEGIRYDSSIFPIRYYRYGIESAPHYPFRFHSPNGCEMVEFPISTLDILHNNIPFSGGGYFRLLPYWFVRRGVRRQNKLGRPAIFYLHPWEFDPDQPKLKDLPRRIRFPHYVNIHKTEDKLKKLLCEFRFSKMSDVIRNITFK